MIKQLLAATMLTLAPYKAYIGAVQTFNKQLGTEYTNSFTNFQITAGYSFNTEDDWQFVQNTIQTRTITITSIVFNNGTTPTIECTMLTMTEIKTNDFLFDLEILTQDTINNTNLENLIELDVAYVTATENDWAGLQQQAETVMYQRKTEASQIHQQIVDVYDYGITYDDWDDNDYNIKKTDYPNTFQDVVNSFLTNGAYINQSLNWTEEDEERQRTISYLRYIKLIYQAEATYQEMNENTKNVYKNTFIDYRSSLTYELEYVPIVQVVGQEVIDIPGLLFTILGMPFAWISTAFNLTIFPGTPYSINISHLILALIGVLIAIFIIKKLIR